MPIRGANAAHEKWLAAQLAGDLVEGDLARKRRKMADSPFGFLRATYWRWAETILEVCPDLAEAPWVLAVGDIHLENFGTWRDVEGRIVWGVNDFDEAAEMPYALDLVRLAASAVLAESPECPPLESVCGHIVEGYESGLESPNAFVLDRQHMWMRTKFVVSEGQRAEFWRKLAEKHAEAKERARRAQARNQPIGPPQRFVKALDAALPDENIALAYWPRTAGTGSLGRPRWVGFATWRGAPLLREAKALVPSGWTRANGNGSQRIRLNEIAQGKFRSPDPWYRAAGNVLVRRLSPNNRKLEIGDRVDAGILLHPDMLWAMGRDLAAIHIGVRDRRDAIKADLDKRKKRWIRASVEAAAEFIRREHEEWRRSAKVAAKAR
jgi:Uncharacterized protein conserved in bacteria (DUF2252)